MFWRDGFPFSGRYLFIGVSLREHEEYRLFLSDSSLCGCSVIFRSEDCCVLAQKTFADSTE
ncbi:MAG TPA: hypothetical protein DCY10_04725 [Clostridiales bacterium]|jgi:hypothetical protein|nr:hypothetical protein [Clostridiales bacterium]